MQDTSKKQQFTALLIEHRAKLSKVCMTYTALREDREDLYQDIVAQLWRSYGSYDPQRPFATWMFRVSLNVAISYVRRVSRRLPDSAESDGRPHDPPDPRSEAEDPGDRGLILQRLMAGLDELDRALLLLHLEERSYSEIADVLGLTESNVGTKLNRIRDRLRRLAAVEMES